MIEEMEERRKGLLLGYLRKRERLSTAPKNHWRKKFFQLNFRSTLSIMNRLTRSIPLLSLLSFTVAEADQKSALLSADSASQSLNVPMAASPKYQTIDEAIAKGDIEDVKLHLAADPKRVNQGGKPTSRPPLEQAILRNKADIALLLIASGADVNTVNASQRTPLHISVERNNPQIATALLKAGAKPNERDKDGWTPLHHAAAKNQLETAKAILAGGADPSTLSQLGGTPLHEAAASGGAEIVQLFLDHKVDPKVKSKTGVTALDIAKEYKNQPAIDVLSKL